MAWNLLIDGEVATCLELRLEDLQRMPQVSLSHAVQCRSGTASGGTWGGVPLQALLASAGPASGAARLMAAGRDGHQFTIDLLAPDLAEGIVALTLDEVPLTEDRGFPARLLVPGPGGKRSVKWLARLTLAGR